MRPLTGSWRLWIPSACAVFGLSSQVWASSPLGVPHSNPEVLEILGGEAAENGIWPAVVGIGAVGRLCTGTVIDKRLILTAAHCLLEAKNEPPRVYVGENVNDARSVYVATRWDTDPRYCEDPNCGDDAYDFAYIEVGEDIDIGKNNAIAKLILDQDEWDASMRVGSPIWLVGFGEDELEKTGIKRYVQTKIRKFTPRGFQFLAGGEGLDSCNGDSGGPAYVRLANNEWRVAGVLSAGSDPCGDGGYYGVPLSTLEWLNEETGYDGGSDCIEADCLRLVPDEESDGCACRTAASRKGWGGASLGWLMLLALRFVRPRSKQLG